MNEVLNNILSEAKQIAYGFVTSDGVVHKNAKRQYYLDNYRLMSIDEIIKYKVGTCYEQTEYVAYLLEQNNIPYKKYNIIYDVEGKIARHTFCVVNYNDKYILMESEWLFEHKEYDTLEDVLVSVVKRYPRMYKIEGFDIDIIEIYEYDSVQYGCNFYEFTDNVRNTGKPIKVNLERIYE
jgi:acyl carrier protein phosphodiesterase